MVKHLCEVCGKEFSDDNLNDSKEHESIPIKEGNYHGVIIKDRMPMTHYRLLIKSDSVSEEHERKYDSFSVYPGTFGRGKIFKSVEGYEKELIERLIESDEWQGLKKKELTRLANLLDKSNPERKYEGKRVEEFKTI